ncbi:hypothetical protein ABMA27_014748 [Loxostege sticticalis]|uniref:D-beta-hydroxybutyrate dehydrogenase, mitochondrial n=1 Tax=Loxostege sticticalis TaxID=481309 RepID=A0ABR3IA23_LOXSC
MSGTRVVAITGCDSGLGWAIAARSAREGLVTAAQALKKLCAHPCPLDVTDQKSVTAFKHYVDQLLRDNPDYKLHAIVNNAGVMTIGDYEWQRPSMIEATINVNLLGAMRVVSTFLPDLRRTALQFQGTKPRVINIASHCGLQPLAGFGAYSASKAGLLAWTTALRLELAPHGLAALAFVPGGFVASSNLLSKQVNYGSSMLENLDEEQKSYYGKRITALNNYLGAVSKETSYDSLKDEVIIETFLKALTEDNPKELYKVESWTYWFYYNLLKLPLPESIRRRIMKMFLSFPDK